LGPDGGQRVGEAGIAVGGSGGDGLLGCRRSRGGGTPRRGGGKPNEDEAGAQKDEADGSRNPPNYEVGCSA
jgi:hypothetical protein